MSRGVERVARALCRFEYRHLASGEQLERAIDAGWPRYVEKALVAMRETLLSAAEALRARSEAHWLDGTVANATCCEKAAEWLKGRADAE